MNQNGEAMETQRKCPLPNRMLAIFIVLVVFATATRKRSNVRIDGVGENVAMKHTSDGSTNTMTDRADLAKIKTDLNNSSSDRSTSTTTDRADLAKVVKTDLSNSTKKVVFVHFHKVSTRMSRMYCLYLLKRMAHMCFSVFVVFFLFH